MFLVIDRGGQFLYVPNFEKLFLSCCMSQTPVLSPIRIPLYLWHGRGVISPRVPALGGFGYQAIRCTCSRRIFCLFYCYIIFRGWRTFLPGKTIYGQLSPIKNGKKRLWVHMSTLFLVDFHWISRVNVFPYVKMINDDAEEGGISNGILTSCQPLKVASGLVSYTHLTLPTTAEV